MANHGLRILPRVRPHAPETGSRHPRPLRCIDVLGFDFDFDSLSVYLELLGGIPQSLDTLFDVICVRCYSPNTTCAVLSVTTLLLLINGDRLFYTPLGMHWLLLDKLRLGWQFCGFVKLKAAIHRQNFTYCIALSGIQDQELRERGWVLANTPPRDWRTWWRP
jgi:hypothetical protein